MYSVNALIATLLDLSPLLVIVAIGFGIYKFLGAKVLLSRTFEVAAIGLLLFVLVLLEKQWDVLSGETTDTWRISLLLGVVVYYFAIFRLKSIYVTGPVVILVAVYLMLIAGSLFMFFNPLPLFVFPILAFYTARFRNRRRDLNVHTRQQTY